MRSLLIMFLVGAGLSDWAQTIPLQTFISGGAATHTSGPNLTAFSNIGQPIVFPRAIKFDNGGGIMVANELMFGSGGGGGDVIDPVITFNIDPDILEGQTTISITATMTDNVDVILGRVFYRPILGGNFTQLDLTESGTTFTASGIPISASDNMGLEFYFEAFDADNRAASPSYYSYFRFNPATMPVFTFGTTVDKYRIMAMPLNLTSSNRQVSFIYGALSVLDQKNIRMWNYNPDLTDPWLEFGNGDFQTMDQGKGYFTILKENKNLNLGQQDAPSNNRANLFVMPLKDGWNLIGNPYTVPVDWTKTRALNGNPTTLAATLKKYTGATSNPYQDVTVLQPYEGAFVKVTGTPPSNFRIGLDTQSVVGGRAGRIQVLADLGTDTWEIPLVLKQGMIENSQSAVGMRPDAAKDYDPYDDFYPPSPFDYVQLDFPHGKELGNFSKDVVNSQNEYVWRFRVGHSRPDDITLSWDNSVFGDNDKDLLLYDMELNRVVNMREADSYTFAPDESKDFQIYFGKDMREKIRPDGVMVSVPTPNPFRNSAEFNFALPGVDNIFSVELQILNGMGQPVKTVVKGILPSGLHKTTWNGTGDDGEKTTNGLYYYRMRIDGKESKMWNGRIVKAEMN